MMADGHVPRFTAKDASFVPFDMGDGISGHQAILYKSGDGTRVAGSFKESGVIHEVFCLASRIALPRKAATRSVKASSPPPYGQAPNTVW